MKALIQRVSKAKVEVDGQIVGQIKQGILVFLGFEKNDQKPQVDKMYQYIFVFSNKLVNKI
jgi:D-tyrosyl-tRNA(Tyr) deacylase